MRRIQIFYIAAMLSMGCGPAVAEVSRKAVEQITLDMSVEAAAPLIGAPLFVPVGDGAEDPSPKLTGERAYVEDAKSDGRLRRGAINFVAKGPGVAILEGINCEDGSTARVVIPAVNSKHKSLINDKVTIVSPGLSLEPSAAFNLAGSVQYVNDGHLLFSPAARILSRHDGLKCTLVFENGPPLMIVFSIIDDIEQLILF